MVILGRFLGVWSVHQCPGLQAALAHAFCFLLSSLDDINVAVSQRACLYLTTLPNTGLRALCWCLEQQVSYISRLFGDSEYECTVAHFIVQFVFEIILVFLFLFPGPETLSIYL